MVPEGWDVLPLGEMAEFRNGLNFTKGDVGEPIKIVTIPDFWQRTELRDLSGIKSIQPKKKVPTTSLLESGDMLFVRSNGNPELVGRCLFFPEIAEPVSFSGFTIRGRVDQEQLVPEFAAYVMLTERTKAQFRRGRGGGNISNLSQDILAGVQVALPPLPEQRKIADILSTWDQAIEKTEALLSNARTQKRALMQQLLTGKRRFPAFEGQPWKKLRLGDVADLVTKGTTPTSVGFQFTASGVNFIKAENVSDSGHILPAKTFISDECNEALKRSQFQTGDLLVTIAGAIGRIGIVHEENLPANTNQAVAIIRVPTLCAITRRMLFYWLQGDQVQSIFRSSVTTGAQPNINLKQIGNLPLKFPSLAEQDMIVAALNAAGEEVDALTDNITKLRTEKKALMQQLLTGKRRVVV